MLKVSALSFNYDNKLLFSHLSFTLFPGQLLHLKGDNGSGKTTLLKLLSGLYRPDSGYVEYQNTPILENLQAYQQKLYYCGHQLPIHSALTVKESLLLGGMLLFDGLDLEHLLAQWGLYDVLDTPSIELSMGQRRRLGLMPLIVTKAAVWLLDEPLVGLDLKSLDYLMQLIHAHLGRGGQVVITSHQALPSLDCEYQVLSL
jgi:heme exporter protein A